MQMPILTKALIMGGALQERPKLTNYITPTGFTTGLLHVYYVFNPDYCKNSTLTDHNLSILPSPKSISGLIYSL